MRGAPSAPGRAARTPCPRSHFKIPSRLVETCSPFNSVPKKSKSLNNLHPERKGSWLQVEIGGHAPRRGSPPSGLSSATAKNSHASCCCHSCLQRTPGDRSRGTEAPLSSAGCAWLPGCPWPARPCPCSRCSLGGPPWLASAPGLSSCSVPREWVPESVCALGVGEEPRAHCLGVPTPSVSGETPRPHCAGGNPMPSVWGSPCLQCRGETPHPLSGGPQAISVGEGPCALYWGGPTPLVWGRDTTSSVGVCVCPHTLNVGEGPCAFYLWGRVPMPSLGEGDPVLSGGWASLALSPTVPFASPGWLQGPREARHSAFCGILSSTG